MEQLLVREGLTNVLSSTQPLRTLDLFNSFEPDLVILDLHMPEIVASARAATGKLAVCGLRVADT